MSRYSLIVACACLAVVVSLNAGCSMGQSYKIGPQSHFVYPNSNVETIAPVKVNMTGASSFIWPPSYQTAEIDQKLYNKALAQVEGANVLVDYIRKTKMKYIPIPYLTIYWTEEYIEGTAAKMDVGQQELK